MTKTNRKPISAARIVVHAGALVFCAWWLVATSSTPIPARECFTGVGSQATLDVHLGAVQAREPSSPSCGDLDGLAPGAILTFDLTEGSRDPKTVEGCYGYITQAVQGPTDVAVATGRPSSIGGSGDLTATDGTFSLPGSVNCQGTWTLSLRPEKTPATGQVLSPLDAGPAQRWVVERTIAISQQDACGPPFAGSGWFQCSETFAVDSIAKRP